MTAPDPEARAARLLNGDAYIWEHKAQEYEVGSDLRNLFLERAAEFREAAAALVASGWQPSEDEDALAWDAHTGWVEAFQEAGKWVCRANGEIIEPQKLRPLPAPPSR